MTIVSRISRFLYFFCLVYYGLYICVFTNLQIWILLISDNDTFLRAHLKLCNKNITFLCVKLSFIALGHSPSKKDHLHAAVFFLVCIHFLRFRSAILWMNRCKILNYSSYIFKSRAFPIQNSIFERYSMINCNIILLFWVKTYFRRLSSAVSFIVLAFFWFIIYIFYHES